MAEQMKLLEAAARALLDRRGFRFAIDPMEFGQDAYDISLDAMDEVRICLALFLAAQRQEPSEGMVEAAERGIDSDCTYECNPEAVWSAMVAERVKEWGE